MVAVGGKLSTVAELKVRFAKIIDFRLEHWSIALSYFKFLLERTKGITGGGLHGDVSGCSIAIVLALLLPMPPVVDQPELYCKND